jgi:SAM-dependent methyltransferase
LDGRRKIIEAYSRLVSTYAERFCRELDGKPYDRELLTRFADGVPCGVKTCDLGCGPGHVAHFLSERGLEMIGIDLCPEMIAEARRRYPRVEFRVGDMGATGFADDELGGAVAFYSIIHIERDAIGAVFGELHRVVRPGGQVLLAFHRGAGVLVEDDVLDQPVSLWCTLFEPDEVAAALESVGFAIETVDVRPPYDFEYPTERVYVLASKTR